MTATLQKALARLRRRVPTSTTTPGPSRHQYKDVWTELSRTEDDAKVWVQGSTDEATLERTGHHDLKRLQRELNITAADDVLEIGCGVGRLGKVIAPICRSWTGCDVSPNMLKHAARRLAPFPNVRFVELSGYDLRPVPDESLDAVYCSVVFKHLTEWDRYNYIEDARRILRPGGRLYVDNISLTTDYGWNFFQSARAFDPFKRPPQIGSTSTPQEFDAYFFRAGYSSWHVEVADAAWLVGSAIK
jgi:ubiquinone/menaquinone biosynthesis C-methylase UbiE